VNLGETVKCKVTILRGLESNRIRGAVRLCAI